MDQTGTKPESTPTATESLADEVEVIEYECTMPFDPESLCYAPAVSVDLKEDTGRCFDHLPTQIAHPLADLMIQTHRRWHGDPF